MNAYDHDEERLAAPPRVAVPYASEPYENPQLRERVAGTRSGSGDRGASAIAEPGEKTA
ncbi:hypothetical protein [Actinomadura alba]|uniref:Uncharacterized protein n=1 Tax=Actinomadura alba TaxID=406431 RepID=A0ABR7LQA7_9ACTN|nr:hypothetical protein [Actinomadura alba]MBC6466959.1 hypothetical protein [Actinomadura alba]